MLSRPIAACLLLAVAGWTWGTGCSAVAPGQPDGGGRDAGAHDSGFAEDAGGCLPSGLCEKQQGVCAGAVRACVDGQPEETCTVHSYGPAYADEDVLCDGLDNDCDGLVDVSSTRTLGHGYRWTFQWERAGDTVFAFEIRDGGAAVELFDTSLVARNLRVPLITPEGESAETAWFAPLGESVFVAWRATNKDAGVDKLAVSQILGDGGVAFSSYLDGGAPLAERQRNGSTFAAIPANDGSCIALFWGDSCEGWAWRGMTISPDGAPLSSPAGLVELGTNQCGLSAPLNWIAQGDAGFGRLLSSRLDGGMRSHELRGYDCSLTERASVTYVVSDLDAGWLIIPANLRSPGGGEGDDLWVHQITPIFDDTSPRGWHLPSPDPIELTSGTEEVFGGPELHRDEAGPFTMYWVTTPNGWRARAYRLDGGALLDVTPSEAINGPSWPLALEVAPGIYATGAQTDGGTRVARFFCAP